MGNFVLKLGNISSDDDTSTSTQYLHYFLIFGGERRRQNRIFLFSRKINKLWIRSQLRKLYDNIIWKLFIKIYFLMCLLAQIWLTIQFRPCNTTTSTTTFRQTSCIYQSQPQPSWRTLSTWLDLDLQSE